MRRFLYRLNFLAVSCLLVTSSLLASPALAQSVEPVWVGEWFPTDSNLATEEPTLTTLQRETDTSVLAQIHGEECLLVYGDLTDPASLIERIEALAQWQMDAAHWPAGTRSDQLIGLKAEFQRALRIARRIPPAVYRSAKAECPGQAEGEERLFILSRGLNLFEFHFPVNALGVSAVLFERVQ